MFRKTRVRDVPRAKEACPFRTDSQKAGARRPELLALRPALCHRPGVAAQQVVPGARRERPVGPPGGGVEPHRSLARSGDRTSARCGPFTVVPASNWSELGSRCRFCRNCFIVSLFSGVWVSRTPRVSHNGKRVKVGATRQKKWTSPTGIRTQVVNSPLLRRKLSLESKPKVITRVWGGTPLH